MVFSGGVGMAREEGSLGAGQGREQAHDGPGEERGEGMPLALGAAWIVNAFKDFHQRCGGFHARVLMLGRASVIGSRTGI
jgi:hypothetical protein